MLSAFVQGRSRALSMHVVLQALLRCVLLAGCAGSESLAQPPSSGPVTPVDTSVRSFHHDPSRAADVSVADGRLVVRFRAALGDVRSAVVLRGADASVMQRQASTSDADIWRGTIAAPPEGATAIYTLRVTTARGTATLGPFTTPTTLFRALPWVGQSVGYQIFPERFANGDVSNDSLTLATDEYRVIQWAKPFLSPWRSAPLSTSVCCHEYFGGDLAGIVQRLDSLQSLGVSLLYLNPIFSSGSAHGYDTWDYTSIEPSFGDTTVLRRLLDGAHTRGMRVLFDFVPNHTGLGFPGFQDALARGTASPYWNWFTFTVPAGQVQLGNSAHYATFAGVGAMPKLATDNPAVQQYLLDAARQWMRFGFDGIRVDVPNELRNAAAFTRALRGAARSVKSDAYLVGEIWNRAPEWVQGDQFDALMHYAVGQEILEPFAMARMRGDVSAQLFAQVLADYPEASTAMSFNVIATHDTPRLLTKLGGGALFTLPGADALARQRLASAMLYALPGVPVTFQGDECAMVGAKDEARYPVQWEQCSASMRTHYQVLATLRRSVPALGSSAVRVFAGEGNVLAWLRGEAGAGEVLAVFNAGAASATLTLPAGSFVDLVSRAAVSGHVDVPAVGWRWLLHVP